MPFRISTKHVVNKILGRKCGIEASTCRANTPRASVNTSSNRDNDEQFRLKHSPNLENEGDCPYHPWDRYQQTSRTMRTGFPCPRAWGIEYILCKGSQRNICTLLLEARFRCWPSPSSKILHKSESGASSIDFWTRVKSAEEMFEELESPYRLPGSTGLMGERPYTPADGLLVIK